MLCESTGEAGVHARVQVHLCVNVQHLPLSLSDLFLETGTFTKAGAYHFA